MTRRSPITNRQAIYGVAESQGGYFTSSQAKACGYAYSQQVAHARRGHWDWIEWGLYRLRSFPPTEHADLIRWFLWSRNRSGLPQAVVSHESALFMYGLSDAVPAVVHLTVPPGFRKRPSAGCVLHRAVLDPGEANLHQGFRVTTPLRTVRDVAGGALSYDLLAQTVSESLRRGLVTQAEMDTAALEPDIRDRLAPILATRRGGGVAV